MSFKELLHTVDRIYEATGGRHARTHDDDESVDGFTLLRREIALELKDVRKAIQVRNKLLAIGQDSKTASKSQEIRQMIRDIRFKFELIKNDLYEEEKRFQKKAGLENAEIEMFPTLDRETISTNLTQEQEAEKKRIEKKFKANKQVLTREQLDQRIGIVKLITKHLDEVEKANDVSLMASTSDDLLADVAGPTVSRVNVRSDLTVGDLKEEHQKAFSELDALDEEIEIELMKIEGNVDYLKNVAVNMGNELDHHEILIADLEKDTQKQTSRLQQVNKRLQDVLDSERCAAQKWVVYIILVVILLAMGAVIWKVVQANS